LYAGTIFPHMQRSKNNNCIIKDLELRVTLQKDKKASKKRGIQNK
jgi:hypothetical protein